MLDHAPWCLCYTPSIVTQSGLVPRDDSEWAMHSPCNRYLVLKTFGLLQTYEASAVMAGLLLRKIQYSQALARDYVSTTLPELRMVKGLSMHTGNVHVAVSCVASARRHFLDFMSWIYRCHCIHAIKKPCHLQLAAR